MNFKRYFILFIPAALLVACDQAPNINTIQGAGAVQRVEAEPFQGSVYRSFDDQIALTLISRDECEIRTQGTTLLCKYTKQADALRIVTTALGTNQVIYFRFTDQGIQDNQGTTLLSPERYSAAMEQVRLTREREAQAQREAERQRRQAEERAQQETARLAALLTKSKAQTKVIAKFPLVVGEFTSRFDPSLATITDVSMRLQFASNDPPHPDTIWFSEIVGFENWDETRNHFGVMYKRPNDYSPNTVFLEFKNLKAADALYNSLKQSLEAWRKTYPDLIKKD